MQKQLRKMLLPDTAYTLELEKTLEHLRKAGCEGSIRGDSAAQFIFARSGLHSIELYQSAEGIWVESWDETEEVPKHTATFPSYEKASLAAIKWLKAGV